VAKRSSSQPTSRRPPARVAALGVGALLGGAWGSVMWLLFEVAGRESGARGWAYLAITMAMVGAGVAAIFGTVGAKRRGERIGPKLSKPRFGRRGRR
jgi:hypothetical protein